MKRDCQSVDKKELRVAVKQRLLARESWEVNPKRLLAEVTPFLGKNVLSYFPMAHELDIGPLNDFLFQEGRLFFPKITEEGLEVYRVTTLKPLGQDQFSTFVPHESEPSSLYEIDTILVPLLAADLQLNRLGRGRGYYDRFLKGSNIPRLAILFESQLFPTIPMNSLDQPLDKLFIFT